MNRAFRYVLGQLVVGMIATTTVLAGILWLANSVKFVELIVNRGVSVTSFAYLTMLTVPNLLNFTLPIAAFAVVAFIYSKLNTDRELVVLRAAGLSPYRIAKPAIVLGLILTAVSYIFAFFLTPVSFQQFRELQFNSRYTFSHALLKEGEFNDFGNKFTIYVRERNGESDLRGVLVHDTTNPKEPVTYIAERGVLVEGEKGPRAVVFQGNHQKLDTETKKLSVLYFDRAPIELSGILKKPEVRYREARERGTLELINLKRSDLGNASDYGKFKAELHQRFVSPLMIMGFILVTVVSLAVGDYSQRGQWKRVLAALVLNTLIAVCSLGLAGLSAKVLYLWPVLYVNALIPIVLGLAFLFFTPRLHATSRSPSLSGANG
ncbi:MAG: LptF/LptG family permease [Rhodospirillales bacterium]|nr:LptF/LptG family permease [Rhodospirillales bacterium]